MMIEKIVLIGGGGHAKSVIDVIEQEGRYEIVGIIDQRIELHETKVLGYEVLGDDTKLPEILTSCKNAIIAIGQIRSNEPRVRTAAMLKKLGFTLPKVISPLAYVSSHAHIGEGTIVMHGAIVNANAVVESNCIINSKALIEHDAIIEENCHISTGAIVNGGTVVKANSFFGSGAVSKEYSEVGGFIKAGSVAK